MRCRFISVLTCVCFVLFAVTSCQPEQSQLEVDFTTLVQRGEGRLPGTAGNLAAQDYIVEQFKAVGLDPLEGHETYLIPYAQTLFDPAAQSQQLTAHYSDGSQQIFSAGTDYYPYLGGLEINADVTTDGNDPLIETKIFLGDGLPTFEPLFQIRPNISQTARVMPNIAWLNVNELLYTRLVGATEIALSGTLKTTVQNVNNVIGVRKGTSGTDALMISAHYDHVGGYGDTIYPGALDNASGVAVLLELARQISVLPPSEYDIIFCAFNGEDMGQLGSAAFLRLKLPYKTINTINFDTLGWAGSNTMVVNVGSMPLADQVADRLRSAGLTCEIGDFGQSDHSMLNEGGIPAVTIASGGEVMDAIHLPSDTEETVEIRRLQAVANAIGVSYMGFELVKTEPPLSDEVRAERSLHLARTMVEQYQPRRDEVVFFQIDESWWYARDVSSIADFNTVQALYPGIYFPSSLGEYAFLAFYPNSLGRSESTPDVSMSLFTHSGTKEAEGLQEGCAPLPDGEDSTSLNTVRYQNPKGQTVDLIVRPLNTWESWEPNLRDDNPIWSETFIEQGRIISLSGDLTVTRVLFLFEETNTLFEITGNMEATDSEDILTVQELETLLNANLDELKNMIFLP